MIVISFVAGRVQWGELEWPIGSPNSKAVSTDSETVTVTVHLQALLSLLVSLNLASLAITVHHATLALVYTVLCSTHTSKPNNHRALILNTAFS